MLVLAQMALYRGELERVSSLRPGTRPGARPSIRSRGRRAHLGSRPDRAGRGPARRCVRPSACSALRDESHRTDPEAVEILFERRLRVGRVRQPMPRRWQSSSRSLTAAPIDHASPSLVAHMLLQQARLAALRSSRPNRASMRRWRHSATSRSRSGLRPRCSSRRNGSPHTAVARRSRRCWRRRARCSSGCGRRPRLERLEALRQRARRAAPTSA